MGEKGVEATAIGGTDSLPDTFHAAEPVLEEPAPPSGIAWQEGGGISGSGSGSSGGTSLSSETEEGGITKGGTSSSSETDGTNSTASNSA